MQENTPHLPLRFNIFQQSCYIREVITQIIYIAERLNFRFSRSAMYEFKYNIKQSCRKQLLSGSKPFRVQSVGIQDSFAYNLNPLRRTLRHRSYQLWPREQRTQQVHQGPTQ